MPLTIHNRALLGGMLAAAVALAGASACSRDRADAGRDTTQVGETATAVTPSDTQARATASPTATDTAIVPTGDTGNVGVETATPTPALAESPSGTEAQDTAAPAANQDVSGYQAMGHVGEDTSVAVGTDTSVTDTATMTTDTSVAATSDTTVGDTVAITSDTASAEMANAAVDTAAVETDTMAQDHAMADTTATGYEPMARDTSTVLAQGDTTTPVSTDTTAAAEADTATITAQLDTTRAEMGAESDTVTTATEPIRPPEDSTEVYGQVTGEANADSLPDETARVRPPEDSTEIRGGADVETEADVAAIGDANAEAAGAAQVETTGGMVTGAAAVSLMTREGQRCTVLDPEESADVRWDMASSPATFNPCGIGTMTLPKIWTGEKE